MIVRLRSCRAGRRRSARGSWSGFWGKEGTFVFVAVMLADDEAGAVVEAGRVVSGMERRPRGRTALMRASRWLGQWRKTAQKTKNRRTNKKAQRGLGLMSLTDKEKSGRGERIRTSGLYVPNVALYQAKLHPDLYCSVPNSD
jgi:hypothetical protein